MLGRSSDVSKCWLVIGTLLTGFVIALHAACGADPEVEALGRRVDELSRSLQKLQEQVQALQGTRGNVSGGAAAAVPATASTTAMPASAPPAASAMSELAALKKAWNQIRSGVAHEDVKSLLGSPTQELRINSKLAWYYVYPGIGAGSIFFNDDGRVSSTRSPVFGIGW
jgi:hypothetical protein